MKTLDYAMDDDDSIDRALGVDDLRVRVRIDRGVLTAASGWCTHRIAYLTSPCAPDRVGNAFAIDADHN